MKAVVARAATKAVAERAVVVVARAVVVVARVDAATVAVSAVSLEDSVATSNSPSARNPNEGTLR